MTVFYSHERRRGARLSRADEADRRARSDAPARDAGRAGGGAEPAAAHEGVQELVCERGLVYVPRRSARILRVWHRCCGGGAQARDVLLGMVDLAARVPRQRGGRPRRNANRVALQHVHVSSGVRVCACALLWSCTGVDGTPRAMHAGRAGGAIILPRTCASATRCAAGSCGRT